jgi:hypothetical protein
MPTTSSSLNIDEKMPSKSKESVSESKSNEENSNGNESPPQVNDHNKKKAEEEDEDEEEEEEEEEDEEEENEEEVAEENNTEAATVEPREDLKEELLFADLNYGCILSFYEKFAKMASLKEYPIKTLESHFLEPKMLPKKWCDLHLLLMKHLTMGKHAKKEKWLFYLEKVHIFIFNIKSTSLYHLIDFLF